MTTHPLPPLLLDARARAADASSSALVVTVSLASLAEVHYAVFPVQTPDTPAGDDGPRVDPGETGGHGPGGAGEGGTGYSSVLGAGNVSVNAGERREAATLNDTVGLVVSGVVPTTTIAGFLLAAAAEKGAETLPGAVPSAALGAGGKANTPASAKSLEGNALEVMFRVEGLQAAQAYSVCLFTETPGSNGCVTKHMPEKPRPGARLRCTSFVHCRIYSTDILTISATKTLLSGRYFSPWP